VAPQLETLESGVLHNDANPHNVLVRPGSEPEIAGLTDFGDTVHGPWIFDPAIAAVYALLPPWSQAPAEGAAALIEGYHAVRPITAQERLLLPALIETRLAVSVVSAARARAIDPSNAYISVDEAPAWRLLDRLHDEGHGPLQQALCPRT
jgi:Ser/Thr protein kinase RdoA (MazF antagonist)